MRALVLILVCFAMSVGATAASADSTILSGYGSAGSNAVVKVKGAQASPPRAEEAASAGTLPFTGSELTVAAAAGIVLLGMGFALRRLGRDNS